MEQREQDALNAITETARNYIGPYTAQLWKDILVQIEKLPNGANTLNIHGHVFWQSLLLGRADMLAAMVLNPPSTGLAIKSPYGTGLWDYVIQCASESILLTEGAVGLLAKHLPFSAMPSQPILNNNWNTKTGPHFELAKWTGKSFPEAWIGDAPNQRTLALQLLANLCDETTQNKAFRKFRVLLHPRMNLKSATSEIKLAINVFQEAIQTVPRLTWEIDWEFGDKISKQLREPKKKVVWPEEAATPQFAQDLQERISLIEAKHYNESEAAFVLPRVQSAVLKSSTLGVEESSTRRAAPRL